MSLVVQQAANNLTREDLIAYVHRSLKTAREFRKWAGVSPQAVHKWRTTPDFAHTMTERARAWWVWERERELRSIFEG